MLVITIDTLRADYLGTYDPDSTATPLLDAFARDATVFERASAPMPLTRPSHFSLLTGLYPREHGVVNNALALPESALSVAEVFDERGYRTAAFVGVSLLGPESGAGQGFGFFDHPTEARQRRAEEVVSRTLQWIGDLADDEGYFAWVHVFDPHLPYASQPGFGDEASTGTEMSWRRLKKIAVAHDGDIPESILEEAKALYRSEVSYTDHWIGELLSGLAKLRDLDDTLIVLTADHGECFENGVYFEHADCLFEPAIRIPLIVRYPREFEAGARVLGPASIIDIAPTVLRAAGFDIPSFLSGRSLQDHAQFASRHLLLQYPVYQQRAARGRARKLAVIRSVAGQPVRAVLLDQQMVGIVDRSWKYLEGGDSMELYELSPELNERDNLAESMPEIRDEMKKRLKGALEEHPLTLIDPGKINEEMLETLKALGYLG